MNPFFSFFLRLWRDSQPFGWMGVIIGYFTLITWWFSGWLLLFAYIFNPMTLRVCYQLWVKRSELDALADETALGIRARRELRRKEKEK